jgi:hypothetical protein
VSDRLSLAGGVICALAGLGMLMWLDIPVIKQGGISAALYGFELLTATVVVSVIIGLATREW